MIFLKGSVKNFSSYLDLDFVFNEHGLHLLSGPTGSGKSTVCDIIPWILFGRTAKNGLSSEVVSWNASGDTTGTLELLVRGVKYTVFRSRGKVNDLHFSKDPDTQQRGKDLKDTQALLDAAIGLTAEQFLASSYYHELSPTAQFFGASAKGRRQITEQIVDLSEVTKNQEALVLRLKATKAAMERLEKQEATQTTAVLVTQKNLQSAEVRANTWEAKRLEEESQLEIAALSYDAEVEAKVIFQEAKVEGWNLDNAATIAILESNVEELQSRLTGVKHKISQIQRQIREVRVDETCAHCGSSLSSKELSSLSEDALALRDVRQDLIDELNENERALALQKTFSNPYAKVIEEIKAKPNPYLPKLEALARTKNNPHESTVAELSKAEENMLAEVAKTKEMLEELKDELYVIKTAQDVAALTRQALIETTVLEIQNEVNRIFTKHYDSMLRVEMKASGVDNLDVILFKDGNECSFTQLSKGQRQILKLSFAIACIKAISNRRSIKSEQLFFDEAFDGLDETLKIKSFSLLEELLFDYTSVFVVEHSAELKTMFSSRYEVSNTEGYREVRKLL